MDRNTPIAVLIKMRDGIEKALQEKNLQISPEKRSEMISNLANIEAAIAEIEARRNRSS